MNDLLPPPDLSHIVLCGFTLYTKDGRPHRCDRDAVASLETPDGHRISLCRLHERSVEQKIGRPEFAAYRLESAA